MRGVYARKRISSVMMCNSVAVMLAVPPPDGIQQEFPFSRALSVVNELRDEEAESWLLVMLPSSTPRPCKHTVGRRKVESLQHKLQFLV